MSQLALKSSSRRLISTSLASSTLAISGEDELFRQQQLNTALLEKLSKPVDPGPHLRIKGRLLNLWGIVYAVNTLIAVIIMLPFMAIGALISDIIGQKKVTHFSLLLFIDRLIDYTCIYLLT